jgi:serine/threonine protein kinase
MSMLRKKIHDFYLVEQIGAGGMSEVFLGLNPRTREKRAFKILGKSATLWPGAYARFLREVEIIRSLSHPGIIKILDNGVLDECYFYSMEYMPGGNLTRIMQRGKPSLESTAQIFLQICEAMAYAHENGIIHRDLKPANILLSADGKPVVSDFGIAKILDDEHPPLTVSGEILGTIAYLAPEQRFNTKRVNQRADIYALGALCYEMLMGFPPLGKFPRPREINPDFPEGLQSIIEKCLAIRPEDRFENAGLLEIELEKCLNVVPRKKRESAGDVTAKMLLSLEENPSVSEKLDRIESWFRVLRTGTTRERLAVVREMVDKLASTEAKAILKLYPQEGDRVRWGLIKVLGELKIQAATPLILSDLKSPFHTECAIEALGKIGLEESYNALLAYVIEHPESSLIALVPLANTGKKRAVKFLRQFLGNEMSVLRQAAVRALAYVGSEECLQALKDQLCIECDEKVRLSILQAVHSLESALFTSFDATTIPKIQDMRPEYPPVNKAGSQSL